jgi:hypothetical protein
MNAPALAMIAFASGGIATIASGSTWGFFTALAVCGACLIHSITRKP